MFISLPYKCTPIPIINDVNVIKLRLIFPTFEIYCIN